MRHYPNFYAQEVRRDEKLKGRGDVFRSIKEKFNEIGAQFKTDDNKNFEKVDPNNAVLLAYRRYMCSSESLRPSMNNEEGVSEGLWSISRRSRLQGIRLSCNLFCNELLAFQFRESRMRESEFSPASGERKDNSCSFCLWFKIQGQPIFCSGS